MQPSSTRTPLRSLQGWQAFSGLCVRRWMNGGAYYYIRAESYRGFASQAAQKVPRELIRVWNSAQADHRRDPLRRTVAAGWIYPESGEHGSRAARQHGADGAQERDGDARVNTRELRKNAELRKRAKHRRRRWQNERAQGCGLDTSSTTRLAGRRAFACEGRRRGEGGVQRRLRRGSIWLCRTKCRVTAPARGSARPAGQTVP